MRFLLVSRPAFPIPPDQFPVLVEGFRAWWDRYHDRWEGGFFAGGPGGGGVATVADEVEYHRMMAEWPFTPFSQLESYPLVDVETALDMWQEIMQAMGGGQRG
jgi:hypothetical protein